MSLEFDELRAEYTTYEITDFQKKVNEIREATKKDKEPVTAEDWYEFGHEFDQNHKEYRLICFLVYIDIKGLKGLKSLEVHDSIADTYFELAEKAPEKYVDSFKYALIAYEAKPETHRAQLLLDLVGKKNDLKTSNDKTQNEKIDKILKECEERVKNIKTIKTKAVAKKNNTKIENKKAKLIKNTGDDRTESSEEDD